MLVNDCDSENIMQIHRFLALQYSKSPLISASFLEPRGRLSRIQSPQVQVVNTISKHIR
jgi:hypothetical protein